MLGGTIIFEVVAVNLLKLFSMKSKPIVLVGIVANYLCCYVLFVLALDLIPLGVAYALWGGIGTALVALADRFIWKLPLNWVQIAGVTAIIAGVVFVGIGMGVV